MAVAITSTNNSAQKAKNDPVSARTQGGNNYGQGGSGSYRMSADTYNRYEQDYNTWKKTGKHTSGFSSWGNQQELDAWKSIRDGKVKSARVGSDIYYMDNNSYKQYNKDYSSWTKTGSHSNDYNTWGNNDGATAFRYIRDDQNGYGGLNNLKASLDDEITQAVAEKYRSQWGDKYYYDVTDPDDIAAMNAGMMPAYLRKKYKSSDPIDQYLMEQGLPYSSLFSDMYSEAWQERNEKQQKQEKEQQEKQAKRQKTYESAYGDMASYLNGMNGLRDAMLGGMSFEDALATGQFDALGDYYDSSYGKTDENGTAGEKYYKSKKTKLDPIYDKAYEAILNGETPDDEFFDNFKDSAWKSYLKQKQAWNENSFQDIYDYRAVQEAQEFLDNDTNHNANFNYNNLIPVGKDAWREAGYKVTNDSAFHPIVLTNEDKSKAIVINPVRADGTLIPNDELQKYADSYFGKGLFNRGGEDPDKVIIAEFDSKREANEYAKQAENAVGVLFDAFADQIAQAGAEANQRYEESIQNLETALESGDLEQVRSALDVVGLGDYAEAELADYQGTKINEINDQIREINQQLKTAKGGEEYEALKAEKKRLVEERDNLQAQFRELNEKQLFQSLLNVDTSEIPPEYQRVIDTAFDERDAATQRIQEIDTILAGLNDRAKGNRNYVDDEIRAMGYDNVYDAIQGLTAEKNDLDFKLRSFERVATETEEDARNRAALTLDEAKAVQGVKAGLDLGIGTDQVLTAKELKGWSNKDRAEYLIFTGQDASVPMSAKKALQDLVQYATPEEIQTLNGLALQDPEQAKSYMASLEDVCKIRRVGKQADTTANFAADNPTLASVASVATNKFAGIEGPGNLIGSVLFGQNSIDAIDNAQMTRLTMGIRQKVSEDIIRANNENSIIPGKTAGEVWSYLYQIGMSMGDSLTSAPMGNLGLGLMGGSAMSQTLIDQLESGASIRQAYALAAISGTAEILTEKFSLENLVDIATGQAPISFGAWAMNTLKQSGIEASEEFASEVINMIGEALVRGDQSDLGRQISAYMAEHEGASQKVATAAVIGQRVLEASVGGALSGGLMGGGGSAINLAVDMVKTPGGMATIKAGRQVSEALDAAGLNAESVFKIESDIMNSGLSENMVNDANMLLDTMRERPEVIATEKGQAQLRGFAEFFESMANAEKVYAAKANTENQQLANRRESADRRLSGLYQGILDAQENAKTAFKNGDMNAYQKAMGQTADLIKNYQDKAVPQYEEETSLIEAKQEELTAKQEQHEADKQNKTADFLSDTLDKIDDASAETVQDIEQAEIEQEAQDIYDSVVNPDNDFDITYEDIEPVDDTASEIARNTVASILNDTERAEALAKSGVNLDSARDAAESAIVQLIKDLGVKKKELTPEVTNEITGLFQDILKGDFAGRVTETIPRRIREAILNSYEVNGYDLKDAGIYTIDDFKKLKALVRKSRLRYHWKKGGVEQREVPPSMRNLARGQGIHFVNNKANTSLDQLYNDISATWPGLLPEAYSSEDQLDALINLLSRNKVTKQKFTLGEWIKSNDAISRGIDDRMVDNTISQMLGDLFVQVMPYLDERYAMEEFKNGRNAETQQIPVSAEQTTTGEEEFYSNAIGEIQVPEDERGRDIEPVGERAGAGRLQGYPGNSEEERRVSETIRGFAGEDLSGETVKQWDETARGVLSRVVDSFNEQSENRGVTSKLKQGDLKEVDPSKLSAQTEYNIRAAEKITGVDETSVFSNDRLQETGLYGVTQNNRSLIADLGGDPMEIFHKVHEDFHRVSRYRDSVDRQMMNFTEDQRNKIFRDYLTAKKIPDNSAVYKGHSMAEEFQCDIGGAYGYFIATGGDAKGFNKLNIDSDTAAFFIVETNNEITGSYGFNTDDQVNPQSEPIEDLRAHGIQSNPDGSMDEANEAKFSIQYNKKYMDKADKINSNNEKDGRDFVDQSVMDTAREQRDQVEEYMTENREALNLPEDIEGNTTVGNASYGLTQELSTVCVRSVIADEFVDAVSEEMGRPLTVEETVFASQDAAQWVKNPQCIYCYVAMDRAAYRQFLLEYIHQRDDVIGQAVSGNSFEYAATGKDAKEKNQQNPMYMAFLGGRSDTGPMRNRYNSWLKAVENASELITEADLASDDAMKAAIARNPELEKQIKDANKYAQSASWAKKRLAYRAYNNSILNWTAERVRNLNKAFGMRMYSFSDYSPAFVLENMQMITDAAVKGLKVLAYTKDLDFVKIFAGTGANINISVFGYMQNGIIAEDAMQGAPWAEAQELRAMYPNVGCTFVATNDAMVEWALAQDWIDVVIPFHLVRTGETVAEMMNYLNYTRETSDQKAPGWTKGVDPKEIYPTVHNNNKEQYMKALEEAHLTPRFERFVNNPNYMKLVNETRRSSGSTFPVQPVFNVGAAIESLEKMKKEGGYIQHVGGSVEAMREIASETADKIRNGGVEEFKDFQRRVAEGNRQALQNDELKLSVMPETEQPVEELQNEGFHYLRRSDSPTNPASGVDYAMFVADDAPQAQSIQDGAYGNYLWMANDSDAVDVNDIADGIRSAWAEFAEENGYDSELGDDEISPPDIVDSAGIWDNPEFLQYLFERGTFDDYLGDDGLSVKVGSGLLVFPKSDGTFSANIRPAYNGETELENREANGIVPRSEARYSYMPENDEDFARWSYRMQWTREQLDEQYRKMSAEKRAAVIRARQRIETRQSVVKRRENIAKNASELRDWFNTPDVKKGKYIPDFLKDSIMTALSGIDLGSTKRPGGKMVQNWRRSMQDLANNLAQYQLHQNGDNSDARFDGIHLELPSGFVEAFQDLAASIPEDGKNYLQDMNADQLEALDKSVSILRSAVRNANRLQANARSQSVAEIGRETVKELGNQKAKKQPQNRIVKFLSDLVNVEMLDAVSYAQRLGNAGGSVINSIINGFLKGTTHVREAQEFFSDALKQEKVSKKDIHKWSNQAVNVTLESGQTIGMTQGQLMNLYALSKRPQALQHLLNGGIELANNKASKNSQNRAYKLTYKDLDNAFANLTETQKRFVDRLQTYLSETASGWGNEVSQELYGINLYGEENYWPIRSAKSGLATQDPEKVRAFNALMNAGFTKSLQKYASNPIMLDDAVQVFCDHVSQMSNYNGMAIPIADAMKWFNYQNRGEDGSVDWNSSVKRSVAETMGNGGTSYFINLIKDINGLSEGGTGTALPSAIVSNTKRAAVAGKLRVMVQQPTAVVRAMSMINPKYFAGFDDAHLKQVVTEMQDNAPIAWWKSQGNFDIGTGKSMRDIISGDSSGFDSVMNATMAPAGLADDLGWSWIWNACKREQAARNPGLSGQELMDKVVERFTDVINKTQVIDTVVHRSQIMRSKDNMVKQSTAFMSEPIKTFNLLHNAVNDVMTGKPGAKLRFAKTLTAVTASWALNAAVLALHDSLRDRDEDEDFWEMVKEKFLKEFKSNANQINAIPYLKDVYALMQGSDVERMELSGISDLISSVQRLYKAMVKGESNYTQYGLYRDLITSAGNILGTPVTGLLNSAEVMINAAAPGTLIRRKTRGWDKAEGLIEQGIDKKQARGLMKHYQSDNTATKAFSILAYDGNKDGIPDFDEDEQNIIAEALGLSYNPEKDGSLTDYAVKAAGNYLKGKQKIMDNENSTDEEYAKAEEAYDKYSQLYDDWFEFLGL